MNKETINENSNIEQNNHNMPPSSLHNTTESTLYYIQNGKPKLIAYASKGLPEAARYYSITELEM